MQKVVFKDLGQMEYQQAWDYQEALLQENVRIKTEARQRAEVLAVGAVDGNDGVNGGRGAVVRLCDLGAGLGAGLPR